MLTSMFFYKTLSQRMWVVAKATIRYKTFALYFLSMSANAHNLKHVKAWLISSTEGGAKNLTQAKFGNLKLLSKAGVYMNRSEILSIIKRELLGLK